MIAITLPPLPRLPDGWWKDKVTEEQMEAHIRARDLEVARLVLEGAANIGCRRTSNRYDAFTLECVAEIIRALEVKHHE